jgi:hypothetical protein
MSQLPAITGAVLLAVARGSNAGLRAIEAGSAEEPDDSSHHTRQTSASARDEAGEENQERWTQHPECLLYWDSGDVSWDQHGVPEPTSRGSFKVRRRDCIGYAESGRFAPRCPLPPSVRRWIRHWPCATG